VTPKKLRGLLQSFAVWPWAEHYDRIRAMRAVIVRKDEEIDAGDNPEH